MALKLFISSLIFITSLSCYAEITIINITGLSRLRGPLVGEIIPAVNTVYAGISGGEDTCDSKDGTTTCDNCTSSSLECNSNRIYDNLTLAITFTSNNTAGTIAAGTADISNLQALDLAVTDVTVYPANTQVTAQIKWSEICEKVFGNTTPGPDGFICSGVTSGTFNLRVGIDSEPNAQLTDDGTDDIIDIPINISTLNATGDATLCVNGADPADDNSIACNFVAYPGDQKVYIDDVRTNCSFPNTKGSEDVIAMRFLYRQGSYPAVNEETFVDLNIGDNATCTSGTKAIELAENEIGGLTNNEPYFFRMAVVDRAGNVGHFTNPVGETSVSDSTGNDDTSNCFTPSAISQNCHVVFPTEVSGLLVDDMDCFITTATYGSPFKKQVKTFRTFRNLFLNSSAFGRFVIKAYYRLSPPLAQYIQSNKHLKPYVRVALWPFWITSLVANFIIQSLHWFLLSLIVLLGIRQLRLRRFS